VRAPARRFVVTAWGKGMLEKMRSLKTKVTLIVTAGVVMLLGVVSAVEMVRVKADLSELLGNQPMIVVSRIADEIDEKLGSAHALLIAMAKAVPADIAASPRQLRTNLEGRTGLRLTFDNLLVFSPPG